MTISEQIAELLKKRGKHVEALEELRARTEKETRTFTPEEQSACDEVLKAIKDIDAQTGRLREMEQVMARAATPVDGAPHVVISGGTRALPPGIGFTRVVRSIMLSQGNLMQATELARSMFRDTPEVALSLQSQMHRLMHQRAAVPAAMTTDPAWAGALVAQQTLAGEFIGLVRPLTITGRLNLRKVPFNVKIAREVTPIGTATWVGEGKPKPVGKGAYDMITVPMTKLALITVQSEELARGSDPNSESLLRDGLVSSIALEKNKQFISANPPVAGISPGGILNGLPAGQTFASSGNSAAAVNADITHAISLLNGGMGAERPAWIMNTLTKTWLGGLQNGANTGAMFPTVASGGTLAGYPIIDSTTQPANAIVLLDQALVLLAEDDGVEIDISREASLQLDSAPADPAANMVSLWQNNLIGLRGEQFTYWMRARDAAVVTITGIGYTTWPPVPEALFAQSPGQQPTQPARTPTRPTPQPTPPAAGGASTQT